MPSDLDRLLRLAREGDTQAAQRLIVLLRRRNERAATPITYALFDPSPAAWRGLTAELDACARAGVAVDLAALEALLDARWPDALRVLPRSWAERLRDDLYVPQMRLVRAVDAPCRPGGWLDLLDAEILARLTSVRVPACDDLRHDLLARLDTSSVTCLDLRASQRTDAFIDELLAHRWPRLETLRLSANRISEAAVVTLEACLRTTRIEHGERTDARSADIDLTSEPRCRRCGHRTADRRAMWILRCEDLDLCRTCLYNLALHRSLDPVRQMSSPVIYWSESMVRRHQAWWDAQMEKSEFEYALDQMLERTSAR